MKISVNNETLKYFSTTQKVQKELLTAGSMELWYNWKGRFYEKDFTLGKLENQVLNKWKVMDYTIPSVGTFSSDSVCKKGLHSFLLCRDLGISSVRKPGCVSSWEL